MATKSAASKLNIYQRLSACMRDVSYIQKEQPKQGMPYSFASHDSVTRACRGPFIEHGVFVESSVKAMTQNGNRTELVLTVAFVNIDDPADRVHVESIGFGIDQQDKGPGKAISYAYKYALLKCLALETGDDPEKDSKDHVPPPTKVEVYKRLVKECQPAPKAAVDAALAKFIEEDNPKKWTVADIQRALDTPEVFGPLLNACADLLDQEAK